MVCFARIAATGGTAVLLAVLGGHPAAAQTITEFSIPTANSMVTEITAGPDGALWFVEPNGNKIGRITTAGTITEFSVPTANSGLAGIATGADGALWFTEFEAGRIGRIATSGTVTKEFATVTTPFNGGTPDIIAPGPDGELWFTLSGANLIGRVSRFDNSDSEFPVATSIGHTPVGITAGPDGLLWFTLQSDGKILRLDPSNGMLQEFDLANSSSGPDHIIRGADGALWFNEFADKIGRITTGGGITEFPLPTGSTPAGITTGPDGAIWFTEANRNAIGRIDGQGLLQEFPVPTPRSNPQSIVTGPDGALWFTETEGNKIGRLVPPAAMSPLFAATLPASRSIQIGNTATAFATIINTGPAGVNCGIVPVTVVPGTFTFQTTDPRTNALTGTVNTPVPIGAGKSQTFVVAFTAGMGLTDFAQVPLDVLLGYDCDGVMGAGTTGSTDAVATIIGVNTLKLTFDQNPVPDVIAVGLTPSNDGFAHTSGVGGTGLFATASSNVGVGGTLTARVRLSDATLPVTATVCETNPGNGQCLSPPGPTVTTTINAGQNQTWSVFLQANGMVAADPARNRAFFEFVDGSGVVRGSTSTAVTTN